MPLARRVAVIAACAAALASVAATSGTEDLLPAGSRWTGTETRDKTHHASQARDARLRVTSRAGDAFEAECWAGDNGLRLRGTVAAGGVVDCVPTGIIRGKWDGDVTASHWAGVARADALTLVRQVTGGGERDFDFHPAPAKRKGDKD